MLANFTRPKGEKVLYFSSSVENGEVIKHDGDMAHAMYSSEMSEISRRADLWHEWVGKNFPGSYDGLGTLFESDVYHEQADVREAFMRGEREL